MSQIDELERRITQALDRISRGIEALDAAPPPAEPAQPAIDPDEYEAAMAALEEERLANAQLEQRIKALHQHREGQLAEMNEQLSAQREALSQLDGDLQRLREANSALDEVAREMRGALEANTGEPHLINKSMMAELEGVRAARAVEAAEARALLDALGPLLAEAGAVDGSGTRPPENEVDAMQSEGTQG